VKTNQADFPVRTMCRLLRPSPSGYYAWLQRRPSVRAIANQVLLGEIVRIHEQSRSTYGRPPVHAELRDEGSRVNHKRVGRLMRAGGVRGVTRRRRWSTTSRDQERLVHHSDRGVQYLSIRYTECLAAAGIEPSVGSRGDSYDNALAESVIGLFKTEVIRRRGPSRGLEDVEFATLEWVWWFNHHRLLETIGYVPPVEFKEAYYARQEEKLLVAALT
jgi:transposase InsO family protein